MSKTAIHERIADLDTRIESLKTEAAPLREQIGNIDRQKTKLEGQRAELRKQLAVMDEKPRVSDHAVVRYLERKYGFNFEDVRSEMLTPVVIQAMNAGVAGVKFNGGTVKLKGKTVTTYVAAA